MGRTSKALVAAALFVAACTEPGGDSAPSPRVEAALEGRLDQLVDNYVESGALPSLYVRVERRTGEVVYEHGAWNPTFAPQAPVDGESWFRIWSMSKIVTITAALDLAEAGVINLDDPVTHYIPEFADLRVAVAPDGDDLSDLSATSYQEDAARGRLGALTCPLETEAVRSAMSVRDLLNHEAGFYYATTQVSCLDQTLSYADLPSAADADAAIEIMSRLPLIQQPGSRYYYGTNTTVLGFVIERATGQSLAEVIADRITEPLGIDGLRYDLPAGASLLPRVTGRDGALREARPGDLDIFGGSVPHYSPGDRVQLGGEGMVSTSAAYADFLHVLLGWGETGGVRILDRETVEELTAPQTQTESDYGHNGYNLWVNSGLLPSGEYGVGGLWIGGGYEGTHFWIDPERGLVGLIMTQVHAPPAGAALVHDELREAFYAAFYPGSGD